MATDKKFKSNIKHKFTETIESQLIKRVVDEEIATAEINKSAENSDFESYVDMMDAVRSEKDYDWQSNISIGEFSSQMLTQSSMDVQQYFQTRDFTEAYLEDESDEAVAAAAAQKELINRTLNQKHLYYYLKYVRAKALCNVAGQCYAICWWEQETENGVVGTKPVLKEIEGGGIDELGNPASELIDEDVEGEILTKDRFGMEIIDNRNIFFSNEYCYSLQEKFGVTVRDEKGIEELKANKELEGYFNLDVLEELIARGGETKTSSMTYNKLDKQTKEGNPINKKVDRLRRFGKYWCKVVERDEDGNPLVVEPGLTATGEPRKDAVLLDVIMIFAVVTGTKVLIAFHLTPFIDAEGNPYKPVIRGLCYVHLTDDGGMGDGKYSREYQVAINDTFNLNNDRTRLATIPTFKGNKHALEDNTTIYMEPNHVMELNNKDDIEEFQISDNISGSNLQLGFLINQMQKTNAIFPHTQGQLTAKSGTTATEIAGADQRSNMRANYKSMTFENTFLTELYWMISQMTFRFAKPETGEKLMGVKVFDFNPAKDYFYKPVSASIETEFSKQQKIQRIQSILSILVSVQHPNMVNMVNRLMTMWFELSGDEFVNFGNAMLNPEVPIETGTGGQQEDNAGGAVASNQFGLPQGAIEQGVREVAQV